MNLIVCEKLARDYSSARVFELVVVSNVEKVEISRIFVKFSEFALTCNGNLKLILWLYCTTF